MMQTLTIRLERPITSARIVDGSAGGVADGGANSAGNALQQDSGTRKAAISQAFQALNGVVTKLNEFYDKVFVEHKEEIAKLSVEIARKILMQKVEDGDYEVESIVKEVLKKAPTHEDLVVHLNPEDLAECQKIQQDEPQGDLAGVKLVSDPKIGRAECLLESPKGIIESLINEHLERVGKALTKAE
jgi:flagellar biosynthesis/type III secretory pathway protein FliH